MERLKALLQKYPLLPSLLSMGWNLIYAIFNGVLGIRFSSWWFITLCAFYFVLGFMRLSAVTIGQKEGRSETAVMKGVGIAMLPLAIVICGMILLTIREQQNPVRNTIIMVTIAAFTFSLVAWSIRNIIKAHREKSATMITLRNISCASAIGSILSLERGMLGTFGDASDAFSRTTEAVSGAVAFLLIIGLGIGLILQSKAFRK